MILQIIQQIFGIAIFLTPGILLSYIIFFKTDIIKRIIYSIVLAVSIIAILGVMLYQLNILNLIYTNLSLFSLSLIFFVILKSKNKQYKTDFNKDIWYLIAFSLLGTLWRLGFFQSIKNFSTAYNFPAKFIGEAIPDLGFYTGISIDYSRFIGDYVFYKIAELLWINKIINSPLVIFLTTFLFLSFIYLMFSIYRNKKTAYSYLGITLMALGPMEIFYTTLDFLGSFSYIALFSLFLLYKSNYREDFQIALTLSLVMMFTSFTSSIINALTSIGFIIALFIKEFYKIKNIRKSTINSFKNKKILSFLLIAVVSLTFIFGFSSSEKNSHGSSNIALITAHITTYPIIKYKDPSFLGLSAIRWQILFFFLCGLTFIFYIIRKRDFSEENLDFLLCLIPILFVSYGFFYVNLPTRIFDYFAFFGILVLKIPKKYFRLFFILSFIFILTTGFYVAKDKKIFFETSDKEIEGAKEIGNSLQGKIFSDMFFINQLISNGYYNVTGANDNDPLIYKLFYQNNPLIFLNGINYLKNNLGVEYIVITKRMQEKYILMLNVPQKSLTNIELYEKNLIKVYDNSDARVYKTESKDEK